jgi:hypothetical protein
MVSVQIQLRRGTSAQWSFRNPILAEGEQGFEVDTHRIKIGDGVTPWNDLSYGTKIILYTDGPLAFDINTQTLSIDEKPITDGGNF